MKGQLNKQKILVIGGSKYLGLAVARQASEAGAEVVIGARNLEKAAQVAAQLPGASAIYIDIAEENTIVAAASRLGHGSEIGRASCRERV